MPQLPTWPGPKLAACRMLPAYCCSMLNLGWIARVKGLLQPRLYRSIEVATPYIVSAVFVITVMFLCYFRPNAGRIFLGCFYLAMALGVNGTFILTAPQGYADYAAMSYWPIYRDLAVWLVNLFTPVIFGILLAAYEVTVGILLLSKGWGVKVGLWAVIVFILGITPLSTLQLPWLGLAIAAGYLLTRDYPRSLPEMVMSRWPLMSDAA
jgi:hypothetical protein